MNLPIYPSDYVIDNTKHLHPCSLMISHFNCPHVIVVPEHRRNLTVYLLHPTCEFNKDNTFSNNKCFQIGEFFRGTLVNYNYPENLYENLLEMWEDFDTLNRRCITRRKILFGSSYMLCGNVYISAVAIEFDWKRQYRIASDGNPSIASGSMDEMISFIEVNYPECINPLQFIKPARI